MGGGTTGFDFSSMHVLFIVHQIPEESWYEYYLKLVRVWSVASKYWNKPPDKK